LKDSKLTDSAQVPQSVVDTRETCAVLWVSNLGEEDGRAHLSHGVAEAQDQATGEVCLPVLANSRNDTTNDHDDTSNGDGQLATLSVCNWWHDEETGNRAEIIGAVTVSN